MNRMIWLTGFLVAPWIAAPATAEVTAERADGKVVVRIDGEPFAEYVTDWGHRPIVWPIIGPTGEPVTRAYPMAEGPNERQDHRHHRSLWFGHGDVGGHTFWHNETVKQRSMKVTSGRQAVIVTENDWLADGRKQCEDVRVLTFGTDGSRRYIDFDITLKASEGPVEFGDTKEGTFAVRVAGTMKVDADPGGRIINSEGQTDKQAWGKPAAWVDYHGPVDGETVGVAILNHPGSFRFPTYWHVRTYGLFAANPFGLSDFTGGEKEGSYTLPAGETLRLRYRVLLHRGDEKQGEVAEAFAAYAEEK